MFENMSDSQYVQILISACDEMVNSPNLNSNLHIEKINNMIFRDGDRKIVYHLLASLRTEKNEVYKACVDMVSGYVPFTNTAEFKDENPAFIFAYMIYLFVSISTKKTRLSEYLIKTVPGDEMQYRYVVFCNDFIKPFTTVLSEIARLSTNYDVCRAYLFSERMPYRDDISPDNSFQNIESETVDSILSSLDKFSSMIKSTKGMKLKQKRQLGSMVEAILYTYQTYKDFKSLCYSYSSLKENCTRLKKPLKKELSGIDGIFNYYIQNYPTGPEDIFEEVESKIHTYERKK